MSAPHVYVEELHEVPIATVWEMLSGFGTWADWFPLFDFMRVINGKDGVGAVRKFDTLNGYTYEEQLIEKNDGEYFLQYDTLSVKPSIYGLVSVKTTIKLETVEANQTKIVWSAWIVTEELDAESLDFILNKVKSVLEVFFQAATQSITQKIITGQYIKDTLASYNGKVMAITRALIIGKAETWEYDDYPKNLGPLPRMVRGLPPSEAMPAYRLGQMAGRTLEVAYLQIAELLDSIGTTNKEKKEDEIDYKKECLSLSNYGHGQTKQRKTLTRRIAERWEDDVEFCQQLVQGVNPLHIRMVKHGHEVPFQMHGLTVTEKSGEIKTVHQLITEKRLLMLDYREFSCFELKEDKYFYPAVMLIYREILDESNSRLNVLGIHLDPFKNEVFTPDMPQKNRFKLARMFIACADNQFHEFRYHLGISHLGMEPIVVAVHNRLPKRTKKNPHVKTHPIRILLEPHLQDTIGINFMARHTLIDAKNPSTDKPFSLGTHQGLKLASNGWAKYDFFKNSFPEDMKARGFDEERTDGVQDYHFRDDGFKLWHAIGHYTIDAIHHIYADDDAVRSDSDLQKWAYEMSDRDGAAIPGFPESIETRKLLAHVIQIIIWNGSALHSSIGMPQFTYLSYVPNRPLAIYKPMPDLGEDGADIDEEYIKRALPSKSLTLFQTSMSWILSLPSETSLMDLMALNGIHDDVDMKFHQNLQRLNEEFRARNKELEAQGKAPYIFLMPENVACSVDI